MCLNKGYKPVSIPESFVNFIKNVGIFTDTDILTTNEIDGKVVTEPSPDDFTRAYQGATDRKTLGDKDQLYGDLAQSRQARYADRVIRDLRRDSTGKELDSDGLLPLPEGIRKRFERTESESP
jgi:hypothetical protein